MEKMGIGLPPKAHEALLESLADDFNEWTRNERPDFYGGLIS